MAQKPKQPVSWTFTESSRLAFFISSCKASKTFILPEEAQPVSPQTNISLFSGITLIPSFFLSQEVVYIFQQ